MGLTHYYSFKFKRGMAKQYQLAVNDCARIIKTWSKVNGGLSGYTPHTPLGAYGGIEVNGAKDQAHEPFVLPETFKEACSKDWFVKTAGKSYDPVVRACLLALSRRLGDSFEYSSDCTNKEQWERAIKITSRVLRVKSVKLVTVNENSLTGRA